MPRLLWVLVFGFAPSWAGAQEVLSKPLAPDQALLEVVLPAGEKDYRLFLNGVLKKDNAFRFLGVPKGGWYRRDIKVILSDGTVFERQVQFRSGFHVTVPVVVYRGPRPELVVQSGHSDAITGLTVSPDGKHLVTAGSGGRVAILWDIATGRKLRTFSGGLHWVWCVAFAPDGKYVALGLKEGGVVLFDISTGERVNTIAPGPEVKSRHVRALAYSRDGRRLLIGCHDQRIYLWDLAAGRASAVFEGHQGPVLSVAFHPQEGTFVSGSMDQTAIIWEVRSGARLYTLSRKAGPVWSVTFSRDGKQVLTGDDSAALWTDDRPRPVRTYDGHEGRVRGVLFTDSGRVVTASEDGTVALWSATTGKQLDILGKHTREVFCLAASPDGRSVFSGGLDAQANQWNLAEPRRLQSFRSRSDRPYALRFTPDGKRLVSTSDDGLVLLWNPASAVMLRPLRGHNGLVRCVDVDRAGKHLLTASDDRTVRLWSLDTGNLVSEPWTGHSDWVMAVTFSQDGTRAVSSSRAKRDPDGTIVQSGEVIVWEVPRGKRLHMFQDHQGSIWDASFSPDGRLLVTAGEDGQTVVRELSTGRKLTVLREPDAMVVSCGFSPDGRYILTASMNKIDLDGSPVPPQPIIARAILWDAATGAKIREFLGGHELGLSGALFLPDGNRFLAVSFDGTICLWDISTGTKLRTFRGHTGPSDGLAVHPSGRYFATSAGDGTIRYWDLATGEELAWFVSLDQGKDWIVVTPDGLFDGSAAGRENVWFRLDNKPEIVKVDRFFRDFNRAGLLASLWAGRREMPAVRLGGVEGPLVKIVTRLPPGPVREAELTLDVEIHDRGSGVGPVHLRQSGSQYALAPFKKVKQGNVWHYQYKVDLLPEDNTLEVQAESETPGAPESEPQRLQVRLQQPRSPGKLHVLAVGVSRYRDAVLPALRFAHTDASALEKVFRERGPRLFRDVILHTLLDDQATREGMLKRLDAIAAAARPEDTVVVFLAGHGLMEKGGFFFMPHDYEEKAGRPKADNLADSAVSGKTLIEKLLAVKALNRLVVLDACHAGAVVTDMTGLASQADHLTRNTGVFFLVGAMAGQIAEESQALGHGVLTYTLLAAVKAVEHGRLKNTPLASEYATALRLLAYVAERMPELLGPGHEIPIISGRRDFEVLPVGVK